MSAKTKAPLTQKQVDAQIKKEAKEQAAKEAASRSSRPLDPREQIAVLNDRVEALEVTVKKLSSDSRAAKTGGEKPA